MRKATERPEGVEAGLARLVGTDPAVIVAEAHRVLDDAERGRPAARAVNPYGDGRACERIIEVLARRAARTITEKGETRVAAQAFG